MMNKSNVTVPDRYPIPCITDFAGNTTGFKINWIKAFNPIPVFSGMYEYVKCHSDFETQHKSFNVGWMTYVAVELLFTPIFMTF